MTRAYRVRHLTNDDIWRSYPLIQAAFADLSLDDWTRFARTQMEDVQRRRLNSGIVAVENESGYLHGLFSFKIVDDGLVGRVLNCDHFVVLDFLSAGGPMALLIAAAEDLARQNNCVRVHICIPTRLSFREEVKSSTVKLLNNAGFDCESIRFRGVDGRVGGSASAISNSQNRERPQ